MTKKPVQFSFIILSLILLHGCAVVSVVDTAASAAVGVVKIGVKGTIAVVDAVIPDGDDEDDE